MFCAAGCVMANSITNNDKPHLMEPTYTAWKSNLNCQYKPNDCKMQHVRFSISALLSHYALPDDICSSVHTSNYKTQVITENQPKGSLGRILQSSSHIVISPLQQVLQQYQAHSTVLTIDPAGAQDQPCTHLVLLFWVSSRGGRSMLYFKQYSWARVATHYVHKQDKGRGTLANR